MTRHIEFWNKNLVKSAYPGSMVGGPSSNLLKIIIWKHLFVYSANFEGHNSSIFYAFLNHTVSLTPNILKKHIAVYKYTRKHV